MHGGGGGRLTGTATDWLCVALSSLPIPSPMSDTVLAGLLSLPLFLSAASVSTTTSSSEQSSSRCAAGRDAFLGR